MSQDQSNSEPDQAGAELQAPEGVVGLPQINRLLATLISVGIGLLIAIGELDHLISQMTNGAGRSWSPTGLTSLGTAVAADDWGQVVDGWDFLAGAPVGDWMLWYGILDLALVIVYCWLLVEAGNVLGLGPVYLSFLALGVAADALENVGIMISADGTWLWPLVSAAKWTGLLVAVAILLFAARKPIRRWIPLVGRAVYTHRYSAIIVLPIAVLSLARGPDILEQLPDIQRRWADDGGWFDFVAAALVTGVLTFVAFVIGRLRSHHLWQRTRPLPMPDTRQLPSNSFWLVGPAVLVALGAILETQDAPVSWKRMAIFCAVPVLIGVVSHILRVWCPGLRRPQRKPILDERFPAAALVGDLLPGILLIVAGLGAIRAFTAVLALDLASTLEVVFLVLGAAAVVGTWPVYTLILRRLRDRSASLASAEPADRRGRFLALLTPSVDYHPGRTLPLFQRYWLSWSILVASVLALAVLAVFPVPLAEWLGVVAVFQLCLGVLSVLVAALVITQQPTGSPEIFWVAKLPYTPVTSLVVGACLIAALLGGGADVHGIRTIQSDPPIRPTLPAQFAKWLGAGTACEQELAGTQYNVRPLMVYAAEGGGIRAAYWTASGIDSLVGGVGEGREICGSAFLSAGASGGAVGLSLASVVGAGEARETVRRIAGPDALAAASNGLVVRDTIFAATGLPAPSFGADNDDAFDWDDRAELIEKSWEEKLPEVGQPWIREHAPDWDWGPSGALVLNSVAATTGCRSLISQVDLGQPEALAGCTDRPPVADSVDLVSCTGQLRVSTAALLASRFPYVTPAGAQSCAGAEQQIVDGGYAENTGIGTLLDLSPMWLSQVRAHNSCVLGSPTTLEECSGRPRTLVVPLLVYFDNGTGSDLAKAPPEPLLELLVPPLTNAKAKASLASTESLLQRAAAALASDQLWGAPAPPYVDVAVNEWRQNSVYVMYQATKPGITAPLGWVLSRASRDNMDEALTKKTRALNYGTITELNDLIKP